MSSWKNEQPSRYELYHYLAFTKTGQEPGFIENKRPFHLWEKEPLS